MSLLKNIIEIGHGNIIISSINSKKELKDAYTIYSHLHNNKQLGVEKRILFFFLSKKCFFIVKDANTYDLIGIEFYYANKRDVMEKTIHQGFRGILPEWQGKKIGTMLTTNAINHFRNNHIDGITSRVSLNNKPSLISNMKLGFRPIELYFDNDMNEDRYYLVCPLNKSRHWDFLEINTNVQ